MHPTLPATQQERCFLFLQGVRSPFFPQLADALRGLGHGIRKVNFTVGDRVYWRRGDAASYRGPMDRLPEFYAAQFEKHGITDLVLFGDCRPVHRPAIERAKAAAIRVHVFEEGYFRPFWITLEQGGVNGHSSLPMDPDWYREQAKVVPNFDNGLPFKAPFWKRAAYDVGYNFWAGLNPVLHGGVKGHVPYTPLTEYLGYVRRGIRVKLYEGPSRRAETRLIAEAQTNPYFILPLQLAEDAQIVHHSPYSDMAEAMQSVITSFARFSPTGSRLAVKIHPLDPGLVDYRSLLISLANELGVRDRVFYLESGNLPALLSHTAGVVTVNSTVGGSALIHGKPTVVLGNSLYGIPGLTYQNGLDTFWTEKSNPDMGLLKSFRNVVIHKTQINGGFYSQKGIELAIKNSLPKLLG
ncbi:capsule biosynthesis protein [Achromobacter spanius]|uniref:capsule biosynthesis protein n=1 Tax=Achromobacter spanius TaxID=217203 RepID=UPI0036F06A0C